MGRQWWTLVVLGVLLFVILSLAAAPAQLLVAVVDKSGLPLRLQLVDGTIWQGRADNASVIVRGAEFPLGQMSWEISPLSLLTLSPKFSVSTDYPGWDVVGKFGVTAWGRWSATDLQGRFPLSILEPWVPLLFSGECFFSFSDVRGTSVSVEEVVGQVNLQDVFWQGGTYPMLLGHYRADVSQSNDDILMEFADQTGSNLSAQGGLHFTVAGHYELEARLKGLPDLAPEVMQSITWLGARQSDGSIQVEQQGSWR